jgi:hypothetical protein
MAITRSLVAIVVGIGIGGIAIGRIGVAVVDRAIVGWIAVIIRAAVPRSDSKASTTETQVNT